MTKEKKIIGYTTGVFDLLHIGHINILKEAKDQCDFLIVGVSVDSLVEEYKHRLPVIPFEERIEIIRSLRFVDMAVPQHSMNKFEAWKEHQFQKMFVGDDWKNTSQWLQYEEQFKPLGVEIIYIKRKHDISSSILRNKVFIYD